VKVDDLDAFFLFVERVFQFRRKQLRSSVARVTGETPAATAGRLGSAGIDPARRPETLNLEEWQTVYEFFNA
jgi:16S rRNA A1518/A1519 N6-dimethyltransferase RsmA/KsgA/DIM1 with predicted DNA glycosylase/AP lyase activity